MSVNNVYKKLQILFNFCVIFEVGEFLIISITQFMSPIYFATAPKKGSGTLRA